jgi:hypothetical protein
VIVGFCRIAETELWVLSFDNTVVGVVQRAYCFVILGPAFAFGDSRLWTVVLF